MRTRDRPRMGSHGSGVRHGHPIAEFQLRLTGLHCQRWRVPGTRKNDRIGRIEPHRDAYGTIG